MKIDEIIEDNRQMNREGMNSADIDSINKERLAVEFISRADVLKEGEKIVNGFFVKSTCHHEYTSNHAIDGKILLFQENECFKCLKKLR